MPRTGDEGAEDAETRRIQPERGDTRGEDLETQRVVRAGSAFQSAPGEYPEANEYREESLREAYGGVDLLASFVGCVFALLCGGVLLSLSGLALAPLGFTLNLEGRQIDNAVITGIALVGLVLFLSFFFGGYVAGRLVRFDGGRNGAMTVAWGVVLSIFIALFGSFLPGGLFVLLQNFFENNVLPAVGGLTGLVALGIVLGALILELLGGFLGGRLGIRYHTRIDNAT
jgi:MFS family permease